MNQNNPQDLNIFIAAYWHDVRFKNKPGGLIRMFELADNLTKMGHKVTLILPKLGFPQQQTIARVIEIPFLDFAIIRPVTFHLFLFLWLMSRLHQGIDFIYVRRMNSFFPLLAAKLYGVKSFFEMPNDPFLSYQTKSPMKRFLESWMDKTSMALSEKIVVLSGWSKDRLSQIGKLPESKIMVFSSGTDTSLFTPIKKEECCQKIGLDPSSLYVGFMGTFFEHQGVDTMIDAGPAILEKFPNVKFLLVGDGPMLGAWKEKITNKGLENSFMFTGQVPYKQVPSYVCAMDICVAPHQADSNQASPVKLFDYMACARPVVASDIKVVREIMGNSDSMILVPPDQPNELAKAVISLLKDKDKRNSMGNNGREHVVENFDRRKLAENLVCVGRESENNRF